MFANLFKNKETSRKKEITKKGELNNELIYEILNVNTCLIIKKKNNETISKLKFKAIILSIILFDNEDLIFELEKEIIIYRKKENKYCLLQEIDIGKGDYADQEIIT